MIKVITYGTFDLLHYGHIRLLERAKALGDYLIVGVTSDDFDVSRGKINNKQSLMERIEAVRNTGLADEIIIEEYYGQKIDDIRRMDVDVFTVGSDWKGEFDYLNEFCKVIYLDRTEGISSTKIRSDNCVKLGVVGDTEYIFKFINESRFVNGITVTSVYTENNEIKSKINEDISTCDNYQDLVSEVDAVFLISEPKRHYEQIKYALNNNTHVLCEAPFVLKKDDYNELNALANNKKIVLNSAIRTAYSTAYERLKLLIKSGIIGDVVSVDSTCTSLRNNKEQLDLSNVWNSICTWGPTAMLPVFDILGTEYSSKEMFSLISNKESHYDDFTRIIFNYKNACACVKVANGVKSESELIISGTKGYIFVPAPWWKTDYFEVRFEDSSKNKRYFYQLDGEGIRYEIVSFLNRIQNNGAFKNISDSVSNAIINVIEDFYNNNIIE